MYIKLLTLIVSGNCAKTERDDSKIERWILEVAAGDESALGQLYEATKGDLYGLILSIVKNTDDAEDILQDTYVKIYKNADKYESMGKPLAWIFTIGKNLSLMRLRERKKTIAISEQNWEGYFINESRVLPEDKIVLIAALENLSEEEMQIVMLHAVSGYKHREIGEFMSIPLSTVLSKYNRALGKLRKIITEV